VKVRIAIGVGGTAVDADDFDSIVSALAAAHFDSLWISEVLTGQGPDPLIALATAAQLNPKIKLGTTMLLPGRHEMRLAKALASLDVLSRGRLLVTFVPGLTHGPERDAIGVPVSGRAESIERTIPRLRRWWAGEAVDGVTISPRPIQHPLEIWLGGIARPSLVRCGTIADGWLGAACTPEEASEAKATIEAAAASADRQVDPEHFGMSIGYSHSPLDERALAGLTARLRGRDVDPKTLVPIGFAAVRETLQAFISVGLSKFVLRPMSVQTSWRDELAGLADAVADLQT
jgi:probable F420-dependent oxidoreductase